MKKRQESSLKAAAFFVQDSTNPSPANQSQPNPKCETPLDCARQMRKQQAAVTVISYVLCHKLKCTVQCDGAAHTVPMSPLQLQYFKHNPINPILH